MPKVFFKTFGCRTNTFDTQIMRSCLKDFALASDEECADIVIVNSCTVTDGADSGVRSYVKKLHRMGKKIYFAGCGVHTQGKELYQQGFVCSVFSHSFKEEINELLLEKQRFFKCEEYSQKIDSTLVVEFIGKSRAFIKIQEGCNFECSYCIIPYVRGAARSQDMDKVLQQITLLCEYGMSEFVLTGTNVGSYGKDNKPYSLSTLIAQIAQIKGVKRIRIGSLEPSQIDFAFKELLDEPFMARHLHIALQHTSNTMLEIMKRKNRFESDRDLFEEIAQKGYALGTDYIIGHPGEDDAIFNEGLKNLSSLPLTHIHPFIYSKREGTLSATMQQQCSRKTAKEHLSIIKDMVEHNNFLFRKKIQAQKIPLKVLIEHTQKGVSSGLDQFFNRITFSSAKNQAGTWVEIEHYDIEKGGNCAKI